MLGGELVGVGFEVWHEDVAALVKEIVFQGFRGEPWKIEEILSISHSRILILSMKLLSLEPRSLLLPLPLNKSLLKKTRHRLETELVLFLQ